jgi:hypothetical protein
MGSQEWQSPQRVKNSISGFFEGVYNYLTIDVVKGNKAIFLALLMASVRIRWCLAQLPEILRGVIFPRSVVKYLRVL